MRFIIIVEAGALIDASGLQPSAKGWRIRYAAGSRDMTP